MEWELTYPFMVKPKIIIIDFRLSIDPRNLQKNLYEYLLPTMSKKNLISLT